MALKPGAGIFSVFSDAFSPYKSSAVLVEALRASDTRAIAWLLEKSEYPVRLFLRQRGLELQLCRDFQHDGVLILIDKIKNNTYITEQASPVTYLVGICKYLIMNHLRAKKQVPFQPLSPELEWSEKEEGFYHSALEMAEMLDHLLEKLGSPCNELIRLKYLEGYKDEEIIAQNLTRYSSGDSLRNTRSQCMKKLTEMARAMNLNL